MLKIQYVYIILCLILLSSSTAFADCYTGFACSIADLEKQQEEQLNKDIDNFEQYLKQKNSPKEMLVSSKIEYYNDLFIFNPIFQQNF